MAVQNKTTFRQNFNNSEINETNNTKVNQGGNIMKLENTKAQMRKGVLEYCILLVLENKPLYVSDIIQNLEKSKMIVVEGTLYPMLTRLKNEGYLGYRWEESLQGPPRKYYELTETGQSFLNELANVWNDLVNAVFQINDRK
jgi:PadR family transcriptional regulator, regulatory protein PadR